VFAELQESLDTAAGPLETTAVGHLHGALLAQLAVAAKELGCRRNQREGNIIKNH